MVGALPHLTRQAIPPQAPTSTSGPERFKSRRPPEVPGPSGDCLPRRQQPAAVPAAAPAAPRALSWRSFVPSRPAAYLRQGRGAAAGAVPAGDPRFFGGNFTAASSRTFLRGCGWWRLCFRRPGAGWRRARSLDARVSWGGFPVHGANSCRPRPTCPTVTRSIKLIRTLGGFVDRLAVPKKPRHFAGFGAGSCLFWLGCFGGGVGVLFSKSPRGRQRRAGHRGRPNPRNLDHDLVTL
ncbi:hypothetical protein QFZ33_004813 [Arthrobacter globiformis]|nr:hypothetical protein [Arthrobacter globiformis]